MLAFVKTASAKTSSVTSKSDATCERMARRFASWFKAPFPIPPLPLLANLECISSPWQQSEFEDGAAVVATGSPGIQRVQWDHQPEEEHQGNLFPTRVCLLAPVAICVELSVASHLC